MGRGRGPLRGPRLVGGPLVPALIGGDRRRGADGLAAPRRARQPDPPTGTPGVVAGHDDTERSTAGDQGEQPPEPSVVHRGLHRADDPIRRRTSVRQRHVGCRTAGLRSALPGRPAADAAALRRTSPRLPDHRRDARPTYREHRADPGPAVWSASSGSSLLASTRKKDCHDPHRRPTARPGRPCAADRRTGARSGGRWGQGSVDLAHHRPGVGRAGVRLRSRADGRPR